MEKPRIVIKKIDGAYLMSIAAGVQSFGLQYWSEDYADMEWYASMLVKFFNNIGVPEVEIIRERSVAETR